MDFRLSEEERLIRETAAQFVHREMLTREKDYLRQEELFLPPGDPPRRTLDAEVFALLKKIAGRIGLWALELAPSGAEAPMSAVARVLVYREFGRTILPFGPVALPSLMASTAFGPALGAGKQTLCLAFDQVHRTGTPREVAVGYREDGGDFAIDAARVDILDPEADLFLLPARAEGSGAVGLFLVPRDLAGAAIGPEDDLTTDGGVAALELDRCRMSRDRLVGNENDLAAIIASEQLRIAARCLGIGMRCLADAIEHARTRVTFGRPLAQRQAVQWMLADLSTELSTATWLTLDTAWRADNGLPYFSGAALAKTRAARMAFQAADTAVQIHGGYGVCKEFPFEGFYREARWMRLLYGREAAIDKAAGERFIGDVARGEA